MKSGNTFDIVHENACCDICVRIMGDGNLGPKTRNKKINRKQRKQGKNKKLFPELVFRHRSLKYSLELYLNQAAQAIRE
jgi:hypothetical protein